MSLHYLQRQKDDQNQLTQSVHHTRQLSEDLGRLKLTKGSSSRPSPSLARSSKGTTPIPTTRQNIRKYLVLLQDSLVIKFVPCTATIRTSATPMPSLPNTNKTRVSSPNQRNNSSDEYHRIRSGLYEDFGVTNDIQNSGDFALDEKHTSQKRSSRSPSSASVKTPLWSSRSELNSISNGFHLYKSFCDLNLQCFWNTPLYEALGNLEYKGYVVPFTVLVSALPRFLSTIRVAWCRQILRSPPGYRIEFIGEVDELLADPIQQSQFAPLSDSICWAILELTSSGQEAFVDSIIMALNTCFPTMIMPARELVYQTLEKLIRDRKIYQTASGYFVGTPDTFRYMLSSSPTPQAKSPLEGLTASSTTLTFDTRQPSNHDDTGQESRNSWDSTASTHSTEKRRDTNEEESCDLPLRRHNSLKILRQRDKEAGNSLKFLRGRSFRMYKSKSIPIRPEACPDTRLHFKENSNSESNTAEANKKIKSGTNEEMMLNDKFSGKSFFKKLFKRSSIKKSTPEVANEESKLSVHSNPVTSFQELGSTTTATQTSNEALELKAQSAQSAPTNRHQRENLAPQASLGISNEVQHPSSLCHAPKTLQIECSGSSSENLKCWNSVTIPQRSPSRLSLNTPILTDDDKNFYSYPGEVHRRAASIRTLGTGYPEVPHGDISRCSTISRGSLGYGSQGPTSSLVGEANSECHSPTPSVQSNCMGCSRRKSTFGPPPAYSHLMSRNSPNYGSYKNSYDYYRRRYPTSGSFRQHSKYECVDGSSSMNKPLLPRNGTWRPSLSQSHYYETIGCPNKPCSEDNKQSTMTEGVTNLKKNESHFRSSFPSPRANKRNSGTNTNDKPFFSSATTTVKQKSTTNMEVELRLPSLGKNPLTSLGSSRMCNDGGSVLINGNDSKVNVNLLSSQSECSNGGGGGSTTVHIGQPRNETEFKATISHCSGNYKNN